MNYSNIQQLNTWDGAFMALSPLVRQQSLRVADYTKALFEEACTSPFGCGRKVSVHTREEINQRNVAVAYKCGLYHQLGKALFVEEDQIERKNFTETEKEVYRNYPKQGRLLVAYLQESSKSRSIGSFDSLPEVPTKNIPWLMIREACEQHMERYDGTGYPFGLASNNISPIGQIVALAKQLDSLASTIRSEEPFDDAVEIILSRTGVDFSPELMEVLRSARSKCRRVFKKYIYYSNIIPKTVPLVDKRQGRPMGLHLYPMYDFSGKISAIDACPWFENNTADYNVMEEQLRRLNMIGEMQMYFLYEACDTLLKMKNHQVSAPMLVKTFAPFFRADTAEKLDQLFEDQPVTRSNLFLAVDEKVFLKENKKTTDAVQAFTSRGVGLLVDNWHPENVPFDRLQRLGITSIRPADDLLASGDTLGLLSALIANGFCVYAKTDRAELKTALYSLGATLSAEDNTPLTEKELVKRLEEDIHNG